jgi:acetyl esterase/lipase
MPDVRVYVISSSSKAVKPAILYIHGGGYVSSGAAIELRNAQELALSQDCVVVTVDYRLAPQTRFPGSLEDNYAALSWLYSHAEEFGVDRTRIAIKGESAAGGHAAALAIVASDRGEVPHRPASAHLSHARRSNRLSASDVRAPRCVRLDAGDEPLRLEFAAWTACRLRFASTRSGTGTRG